MIVRAYSRLYQQTATSTKARAERSNPDEALRFRATASDSIDSDALSCSPAVLELSARSSNWFCHTACKVNAANSTANGGQYSMKRTERIETTISTEENRRNRSGRCARVRYPRASESR